MIGATNAIVGKRQAVTLPEFTYSGTCTTITEENEEGWQIQFLTSGTLNFSELDSTIDVWLVGGGGGGGKKGGGGGGYTNYAGSISPTIGANYSIVIGGGGSGASGSTTGGQGGTSTAFGYSSSGGYGGVSGTGGNGGCGGGAGGGNSVSAGTGGSNGGDGANSGSTLGGTGQLTSTKDWGRYSGEPRCGGGSGGQYYEGTYMNTPVPGGVKGGGVGGYGNQQGNVEPTAGWDNYGGGGGGSSTYGLGGANGGSGIVIIRNHREDTQFVLFDSTRGGDLTQNGWTQDPGPESVQYYTSIVNISANYINPHHKRDDTNSNNARLYTNDIIDFSKFASLHCICYRGGGGLYQLPSLRVVTPDGTPVGSILSTTSQSETEQILNVADLTGSYRIDVYQPGSTNISFDCDSYYVKIWLERQ